MGFPPAPRRASTRILIIFSQKARFCALFGALSGIGGNPTFALFSAFAVSALWFKLECTTQEVIQDVPRLSSPNASKASWDFLLHES